jgi:phosphoglycerate dehydrogenase-like enzyme
VPALDGIDALVVTSKCRVTDEVLAAFPGSLVLTTTSGWDHIDVVGARDRGIEVGRCPLARRDAVVEQALTDLLALSRRLPAQHARSRQGDWARGALPALAPRSLSDEPVLVVGLGVIGRRMASVLSGLGCTVWGTDPAGVPEGVVAVDLDEGLSGAGAVTVHCALSPTSRGLLSADRIARMRPDAVLVNTARGDVVDPEAAVRAVREERLAGFACDVFPTEPYPRLAEGAAVEGVWFTPHASGYTQGLGRRVAEGVAQGLAAWKEGRPQPYAVAGV